MASLRDTVREYQDDLRSGIAWLAFWREGRSWHGEAFRLDMSDYLYPEDKMRLSEIQAADPKAVVVNGYYSGYLGEKMSVDELAAGVRHHYQNGLRNIAPFMEAHDDVLPPEVLEEARAKAHEAGLPFYERPYNGEDIDPYVYDGNMSVEDYELMHRLMEQDNERSDRVNEVFPIQLHNRQLYEQGKDGVWLDMPTTTEQLQAALRQIGISADNPQDFFINGYSYPEGQRLALPYDMVLAADVDELNFLAARLGQLDAAEIAELNAALQNPKGGFENIGQIIDFTENADYYVHLPDVHTAAALGDYYLNRSGMVDMPQEWKSGIDTTQFGRYIAQQEQGAFTEYGYIVKSGDKWQRVHEGQTMPLHEADALFAKLDAEYPAGMGYDKTKFRIDFTFRGQPDNYEGRQDFGDGDGSLIQHIQSYHEYYPQDENWKSHVIAETGSEGWEQDKAERDMLLSEFVPYMKLHCNLSHMEQEARRSLLSGEELTPEQTAYFHAVLDYVQECRPLLNQGQYRLPEPPKLSDFDQTLQDYKEQVQAEIAQEAAAAGMTVEEYAAAGYEAPEQDSFSIYQIKSGDETRDYRFEPFDRLQATGRSVDRANYDLVYTAPLDSKTTLEDIYRTFNIDHPADFKGHSLSVSDVVVLHQGGKDTAHYCESFGFQQVPEFLRENPLRTAKLSTEQNENMIDGVINNTPSMGELEAKVKAGEQISLTDLADATKAEAKKPKAKQSRKTQQKKPSIRAQLKAAQEEQAKKKPAREKSQELEV